MIPHNKPTIGKEEEEAAIRVIRSHCLVGGNETEEFENEFCDFVGLPKGHAVAVSSGTASLYLALWTLEGDKKTISFPGYVCSALRNATNMIGGNEEIIDVAKETPNIKFKKIKKETIAIIPHMYGIPVDIPVDVAKNNDNNIIEDCAQSLGAKINRISVGLHGNAGIFSFYATKLITSGGHGGMYVSKDKKLADRVRDYREFDYRHDQKKRFNFKMTEIQAAIGREQLKKLPKFLERREEIFQKYKKAGLELLDVEKNQNHLSPVRYRAVIKTEEPNKIIKSLESVGVKAIVPTEDWELLGKHELLPNAVELSRKTVSLPIYPTLTDEEIDIILSVIS
jgi:perosamine synthetase